MRNYQTRLARLRELKPPSPPPGPLLTPTELAELVEILLGAAEHFPEYEMGRYTAKHLGGLAADFFEDARKRRDGIPYWLKVENPLPLTAEERLTLLVENMEPRQVAMLYGFFGRDRPEVTWVQAHYEQPEPDGSTRTVERSEMVWVQDHEPYRERGRLYPGGHWEGKDGQKLTSVAAAYAFKDPAVRLQYKALAAAGYYASSADYYCDKPSLPQTVAAFPVEGAGADDLSVDVSQPEIAPLGDDAGAIEALPASPEPSPPPETPALPPERKPRPLIRSGGLRPVGSASGPWRR